MPDELLTINEAARRLKIQPLDLRRLLQAKELTAIETNGQWRISATALQEFIQRGGVQPEEVMDPFNEQLLAAMEISGVVPISTEQQHRLGELVVEGLCYCELRSSPSAGYAPATAIYRLTPAGKAYLQSRRGEAAKGE